MSERLSVLCPRCRELLTIEEIRIVGNKSIKYIQPCRCCLGDLNSHLEWLKSKGLPIPGYVIATIGYALIYTCIYNGTGGSVLLASLYHGASNLTLIYGNVISPEIINDIYLSLPAHAVLVIVVIMISGSSGLVRKQAILNKGTA